MDFLGNILPLKARTDEYRLAQIQWVTGHHGSSIVDIVAALLPSTSGYMCLRILSEKLNSLHWVLQLSIQYVIYVLPLIIAFTDTPFATFKASLLQFCITVSLYGILPYPSSIAVKHDQSKRPAILTVSRALSMMETCLCILAVDFPIFPRSFAKTETFGTSLMDVGVGSTVFFNGIVYGLSDLRYRQSRFSFLKRVKSILPIIILGCLRFASVRGVNYQEHISEYGAHWNFFFTLAAVSLMVTTLTSAFPSFFESYARIIVPISTMIVYQLCLSFTGLQYYILHANRDVFKWIYMNREGIFSLAGYFSLFLVGMFVSDLFLHHKRSNLKHLSLITIMGALGFYALSAAVPPSRRLMNVTYLLCVVTILLFLMTSYAAIDALKKPTTPIFLFEAINRNQLAIFLLANVVTGLINLCMYTIYASRVLSWTVLIMYSFFISLFSGWLYEKRIALKFW